MKKTPLISVIVPVYNGENYLKNCLENILSQSYDNIEIIVVNDGSEDNTAAIANSYPVYTIHFEQNKGLSAARNAGFDVAQGHYIHFMDVDDSINKDYYLKMIQGLQKTGAEIACGGMINRKFRHKTIRFDHQEVHTSTNDKLKATYVGKWGYVWRYLFEKNFLKEKGLRFEEGRFIEDLAFSFPAVFYAKKIVLVPGAEYTYNTSENSIMNNKNKEHQEKLNNDWLHAESFMLDFATKHNFKIPGVNSGKAAYLWWKIVNSCKNRRQ